MTRVELIAAFAADMDAILPGGGNGAFYKEYLGKLTDAEFEKVIADIEAGDYLPLHAPNLKEAKLDKERNLALGEKWGHDFLEHLVVTDAVVPGLQITTPKKYLVLELPVRRVAQTLEQKMAVAMHNREIDDLTGQVTGKSKSGSLTYPELQLLDAINAPNIILELIKGRGGDLPMYQRMEEQIIQNGTATLQEVVVPGSRPKVTTMVSNKLTAAHIENNL